MILIIKIQTKVNIQNLNINKDGKIYTRLTVNFDSLDILFFGFVMIIMMIVYMY